MREPRKQQSRAELEHAIQRLQRENAELRYERLMLAQLASDKPEFFNPLAAAAAVIIRDNVLEETSSRAPATPEPADAE